MQPQPPNSPMFDGGGVPQQGQGSSGQYQQQQIQQQQQLRPQQVQQQQMQQQQRQQQLQQQQLQQQQRQQQIQQQMTKMATFIGGVTQSQGPSPPHMQQQQQQQQQSPAPLQHQHQQPSPMMGQQHHGQTQPMMGQVRGQQQQPMMTGPLAQQQQQQQQQQPRGPMPANVNQMPQQQQQQQPRPESAPAPPPVATPAKKANVGFAPSKTLSKKHESFIENASEAAAENNNAGVRPLYSFQVTKLRSWRTGYVRLMRLYSNHFCTLDPETHQVTNTWPYSALTDWLAIPKEDDTILLQVGKDKLKLKCHTNRSIVMTAILECKNASGNLPQQPTAGENNNSNWIMVPFPQCQRQTRKMTRVPMSLQATPFGLVELHPSTRKMIQIYRYTDIGAASFTSDDPHGIVLYHAKNTDAQGEVAVGRLYFIHSARQGGNGRSDLLTILQDHYTILGLPAVQMRPSTTVQQWLDARRRMGTAKQVGSIATIWPVSKTTRRHHVQCVGASDGWVGGIVSRELVITGRGYLIERDGAGVVNCRPLSQLHAIVRVPRQDLTQQQQARSQAGGQDSSNDGFVTQNQSGGDQLVLEYTNGATCTYTCSNRDALLVSLLDATMTLGKKATVQLSDVRCAGYCLSSLDDDTTAEPPPKSLFQPISIPLHCLNRVYAVSTAAYAFVTHAGEEVDPASVPINVVKECQVVLEACREFNASVLPTGEGLPQGEKDKTVAGTIGALWGLTYELLRTPAKMSPLQSQLHVRDRHAAEQTACALLQSLYRLSQSTTGYKASVELTTLLDCIPLVWQIQDDFGKFWAFRTLCVLVSGKRGVMPKMRDMELEFANKKVILTTGGPRLVNGLVNALLESGQYVNNTDGKREQRVNDLILMVVSDILQSILCSYHDTTTPVHFQAFIMALAKGHRALLLALQASTPMVIENVALLLHLLTTHAPATSAKIRDAALSSATLLHHFHAAIFSPMEGQRFLSRYLCSLWLSGPMDCDEKRLLKRMVPSGFLSYLTMPPLSRMEEEQLEELERDNAVEGNISDSYSSTVKLDEGGEPIVSTASEAASQPGAAGTNTARLRSRIALASATAKGKSKNSPSENFRIFFHTLTKDHSLADLIWNQQTRRELRIALESEIQYMYRETEARGIENIAWNHQQFSVEYPSLENELRVGGTRGVYMRLWLQAGDTFIKTWDEPVRLFEQLFRRFLCESDRNPKVTVMCIRCLERLYAIHARKIGPFSDAMILVRSMASTRSIETQHRLLGLVATILGVSRDDSDEEEEKRIDIPENAEQLLNAESIEQMCQFVAWGHTNGVQVGNLLTTVLSSNQKLLTDGTSSGPSGNGEEKVEAAAPDSSCPQVWFIACTGRIPPPEESIRGPFRVSELAKMLSDGDLSPFDLVTATHVDSYDDDESSSSDGDLKEAHIDTGKWKRLEQVWQLRWQLCTDGSGSGIYSPSEVALLAIRSLTRLVDLHKSLDSLGVPYYPIPIAKRVLCGLSRDPTLSSDPSQSQASLQRDSYLSILTQALLCNDYRVVTQAAEVLHKLMMHNEEATAKFYLTGVFFFICCYTGSNFKPLGKILHATHLKQHFRSGFAAAANESELPMKDRSVLGHMLPQGLLFILDNYGFERFTEVFVGNFDTPEVIWSFEMRKHLIEMIRQHLGDFPLRLWQNTTARYEFCPMPGVSYKRLEKELFCHNYYLANLCDENRFPEWPIAEPVEVFRAALEELKKQLVRDQVDEEDALESARKVLDLKSGDGSKELRKAYRSLARKFHPDKNPAGRDHFEKIQMSYELLLPIVDSGQTIQAFGEDGAAADGDGDANEDNVYEGFNGGKTQFQAIHLLIKTQLLICKRYEKELSRYKYPSYRMILSCLELPQSSKEALQKEEPSSMLFTSLASRKRAGFVQTTVALVYHTCLVSPMNSQELIAEGGVAVLESLLNFYIQVAHVMRKGGASEYDAEECIADIISQIVHTLAGVSFFDEGRAAILGLENPKRLALNWRRCIDGRYLSAQNRENVGDSTIKKYALEGVASMAKDAKLQELLVGVGIVWPLIKYMLGYDPTLEQLSNIQGDQDDVGMSQAASNTQARLSTRALGMLCGVLQDKALSSPQNETLSLACSKLLTSPVALMLRNKRTGELLRTLNTNVETAARIWNVSMRNELNSFLSKLEKERPENECQSVEDELTKIENFEYSLLKEELRIGGVYVRVFNRMGSGREAIREVPDPAMLAREVTNFIARSINASDNLPEDWIELPSSEAGKAEVSPFMKEEAVLTANIRDRKFLMAIKALLQLARVDGLIDDVLCEPSSAVPSVLLSLLELPQDSETFDIGCDILSIMSPKQPFADAVAKQGALWRLMWVLERPEANETADSEATGTEDQEIIRRKVKGWALMESLSSSPSIAITLIESSCWLELLGILVGYAKFSRMWAARVGAAKTISRLMWDPQTGPSAAPLLQRFLPPTLVVLLKEEGPDVMLKHFDGESDTPELIWDSSMRSELRKVLADQLDRCLATRKESGEDRFSLASDVYVKYSKLADELYIGGCYVSRFLKEPTYNLRDPTTFLEMIMQRWTHEIQTYFSSSEGTEEEKKSSSSALIDAGQDTLQLVTSAAVYLCKVRNSLCDKLGQWGYMERCMTFLEEILGRELYGSPLLSVLRILHVAANRMSNVESICVSGRSDGKCSIVDYTIQSIGNDSLHPDTAFMVEMLKKVFSVALGDLKKASKLKKTAIHSHHATALAMAPSPAPGEESAASMAKSANAEFLEHMAYVMAPSPAPGEGYVPRGKVDVGDDPLAMFGGPSQQMGRPTPPMVQGQPSAMGASSYQQGSASGSSFQHQPGPPFSHNPSQGFPSPSGNVNNSMAASYQSPGSGSLQGSGLMRGVDAYGRPHMSQSATSSMQPTHQMRQPQPQQFQQQRQQQSQQHNYQQQQQQTQTAQFQAQQNRTQSRQPGMPPQQQSYQQPGMMQRQQLGMQQTQPGLMQQRQQPGMTQRPQPGLMQQQQQPGMMQRQQPAMQQTQPGLMQQQRQPGMMQRQQPATQPGLMQQHQQPAMMQRQQPSSQQTQPGLMQQQQGMTMQRQQQPAVQPQQQQGMQQTSMMQQNPQMSAMQQQQQQGMSQQGPFPHVQGNGLQQQPFLQAQGQPHQFQTHQFQEGGGQFQVETVSEDGLAGQPMMAEGPPPTPQYRPTAVAGAGIDARSTPDPKVEAEQLAVSSGGAPGAANGRVALLQSALVNELPKFLLEGVLENPGLRNVKDPASTKVHTVELLKLLTEDPGYGMKFQLILEKMPAWKNYKSQDHSLFITGSEQKADYFLTDGSSGEPTKMLTQG